MFKRALSLFLCVLFNLNQLAFAKEFDINSLPKPGQMVDVSSSFIPLSLKGVVVNPNKPLEFQFIVDTGMDVSLGEAQGTNQSFIKEEANKLVKYFLAGLTIPEGDLWVNLSPYEKDRVTAPSVGQTELGRDLLAQDYILKQLTASLIYPEKDLGKAFWSRVYKIAQEKFGTTNVPVNTFNKVWILPDQAQVFENGATAYVTKSTLKVMLDEDYTALNKHLSGVIARSVMPTDRLEATKQSNNVSTEHTGIASIRPSVSARNDTSKLSSDIIRAIVIPEITKEVNEGKNFAPLRQIYEALILAKWYKETIDNGLFDAVYTNKKKTTGVNLVDPSVKEAIYSRYLQAYKKGVFNYIKEAPTLQGQTVTRKYFSGGTSMAMTLNKTHDRGILKSILTLSEGALIFLAVALGTASKTASAETNSTQSGISITQTTQDKEEIERKFQRTIQDAIRTDSISGARRFYAIEALGKSGDKRAIEPLLGLLSNKDWIETGILIQGDPSIPYGIPGHYGSKQVAPVYWAAERALESLGVSKEQLINAYISLLSDWKREVRDNAVRKLKDLGASNKQMVDGYLSVLANSFESDSIEEAESALSKLGVSPEQRINAYLAALNPKMVSSESAINALNKINVLNYKPAIKTIAEALSYDSKGHIIEIANNVLIKLGADQEIIFQSNYRAGKLGNPFVFKYFENMRDPRVIELMLQRMHIDDHASDYIAENLQNFVTEENKERIFQGYFTLFSEFIDQVSRRRSYIISPNYRVIKPCLEFFRKSGDKRAIPLMKEVIRMQHYPFNEDENIQFGKQVLRDLGVSRYDLLSPGWKFTFWSATAAGSFTGLLMAWKIINNKQKKSRKVQRDHTSDPAMVVLVRNLANKYFESDPSKFMSGMIELGFSQFKVIWEIYEKKLKNEARLDVDEYTELWARVSKRELSSIDSIRGTILDPENENSVWKESSAIEVALKQGVNLSEGQIRQIAGKDFDRVWAILKEPLFGRGQVVAKKVQKTHQQIMLLACAGAGYSMSSNRADNMDIKKVEVKVKPDFIFGQDHGFKDIRHWLPEKFKQIVSDFIKQGQVREDDSKDLAMNVRLGWILLSQGQELESKLGAYLNQQDKLHNRFPNFNTLSAKDKHKRMVDLLINLSIFKGGNSDYHRAKDWFIRKYARKALDKIVNVEDLIEVYRRTSSSRIDDTLRWAIRRLSQWPEERAIDFLVTTYNGLPHGNNKYGPILKSLNSILVALKQQAGKRTIILIEKILQLQPKESSGRKYHFSGDHNLLKQARETFELLATDSESMFRVGMVGLKNEGIFSGYIKVWAIQMLVKSGKKEAIKAIVDQLSYWDEDVKQASRKALAKLAIDSETQYQVGLAGIKNSDNKTQEWALQMLIKSGKKDAIVLIMENVKDQELISKAVRETLKSAAIDSESLYQAGLLGLKSENLVIQESGIMLLEKSGKKEAIIEVLSRGKYLREAESLRNLNANEETIVEAIISAMSHYLKNRDYHTPFRRIYMSFLRNALKNRKLTINAEKLVAQYDARNLFEERAFKMIAAKAPLDLITNEEIQFAADILEHGGVFIVSYTPGEDIYEKQEVALR